MPTIAPVGDGALITIAVADIAKEEAGFSCQAVAGVAEVGVEETAVAIGVDSPVAVECPVAAEPAATGKLYESRRFSSST
jgi:hypothetical protein